MNAQKRLAIGPERSGTAVNPERRGALRSCPAGYIAEVGLRWCGASRHQPNGGSHVKDYEETITRKVNIVHLG